jgi:hypothetical protein
MSGFTVDPAEIDKFIQVTLDPAIAHFETMKKTLDASGWGSADGQLLGHSNMAGSTAFNEACRDLVGKMNTQQDAIVANHQTVLGSLQQFRDLLVQTANLYRTGELRATELFQSMPSPE